MRTTEFVCESSELTVLAQIVRPVRDHWVARLIRGYVVLKSKRHVHELADILPIVAATTEFAIQRPVEGMRTASVSAPLGRRCVTLHSTWGRFPPTFPASASISSRLCSRSGGREG